MLLPDVADDRDACVERLRASMTVERGITDAHVDDKSGNSPQFCLHYDPELVTLAQVQRSAQAAGARITGQFGHATIKVRTVQAEDGARKLESFSKTLDGVASASVSVPGQVIRVEFDRQRTNQASIVQALSGAGWTTDDSSRQPSTGEHAGDRSDVSWLSRNRELVWSLLAGVLLLIAFIGERWAGLPRPVAIGFYIGAYAFGAFDMLRHLFAVLRRGKFTFDIDLLMLLAAIGAAALGKWAEGGFLLFLFALAHALEHYALDRARGAIRALADLAPPVARVLRDGRETEISIDEVKVDDVAIVRPAERIPVDGVVQAGRSAVNQAPVTGESVPEDKSAGEQVFAGTINGEGALEIRTTRAVGDRTLDRVIKLVEEAQTQKAPTQLFTERFARVFVPLVLVADVLLIVVPPLMGWWTWSTSFYRGMALLVGASPCALALGTPSTVLCGIAQAARNGVLIKGGAHLENLGLIKALALDKTGTLTVGKPQVTDLVPEAGVTSQELLSTSAAVEKRSQHPLALAIVKRAEEEGLSLPQAGDLESLTARGVRAVVDGRMVEIGSLRLWQQDGVAVPDSIQQAIDRLKSAGRSVMAVRHGQRWLGVIGIADRPRENARQTLDRIRSLAVKPLVMLTGDNEGVARAIGNEVGVDEVRADLLPEDKVRIARELQARYGAIGMVGDGVNDAPALANATVGIAMGGAGTAVALETADVALMGDDLNKLAYSIDLSRRARAIIRQNVLVSLTVVGLLILATTTGLVGIGVAVLLHEGSTFVVIFNALRLLMFRDSTD